MDWDGYMRTWETHARMPSFRRRFALAADVVRDYVEGERSHGRRVVLSCSGGKDSIALVAVAMSAGLHGIDVAHASHGLMMPGMQDAARKAARALGSDLIVATADADIWEWLDSLDPEVDILSPEGHRAYREVFAGGSRIMARFVRERGYSGSIVGLRSEESRGRKMNRLMRGKVYETARGDSICQPIVDWRARDVFAAATIYKLPIHPHYRALLEQCDVSPESPRSRVDSILVEDCIDRDGFASVRAIYPELWDRLCAARPEVARRS